MGDFADVIDDKKYLNFLKSALWSCFPQFFQTDRVGITFSILQNVLVHSGFHFG